MWTNDDCGTVHKFFCTHVNWSSDCGFFRSFTLFTMVFATDLPLGSIITQAFTSLDSFSLLAIPLFILAGVLMSEGGVSKRLLRLADVLVGYLVGGLAHGTILASMFFAAFQVLDLQRLLRLVRS